MLKKNPNTESKRIFLYTKFNGIIIISCILTCLTQVVRSSGSLQYKDKLIAAIKSTVHLKCKEAATLGATVSRLYSIFFANITCYYTIIELTLFSDWLKAYSEFSKSAPVTSRQGH